jgi:hypothetical protein
MGKKLCVCFLMALAVAVCSGLFGAWTQAMAAQHDGRNYDMEQNTNRFGSDYKDLDLDSPDPALCADACMNEPRCRAWTYVRPGVQGDKAKCWLKGSVPPSSQDDNCVSGVKRKGGVSDSAGTGKQKYVMEQNTDRTGEDYRDFDLDSPDPTICGDACMNEARCRAWTYVRPGVQGNKARCWLKGSVPDPTPDANCVSGVKRK